MPGGRYMRALAAMYIRMTFRAVEVYEVLEPLLKDYRKLRMRDMCTSIGIIVASQLNPLCSAYHSRLQLDLHG